MRTPDAVRRKPPSRAALAAVLSGFGLSGCAGLPFSPIAPNADSVAMAPESSAPAPPRPERPAVAPAVEDQLARDIRAYYARIEAERRSMGLLRTDDGSRDIPVSASRLARIWTEVALRNEHEGPSLRPSNAPAALRRWEIPVTYRLEFGASVPPPTQSADRAEVARLVRNLAEATGHPIRLAPQGSAGGNFHVLVLSEAERRAIGPRLRQLVPGMDERVVQLITDLPREIMCIAVAFARGGGSAYTDALAVIRAEHPDLTRIACYHEEMAQGLGVAADSPNARPSIFNDDMEFARLTAMDLLLLRLHYDRRLRPGMREAQARPIALTIARELAAGES